MRKNIIIIALILLITLILLWAIHYYGRENYYNITDAVLVNSK